MPDDIGLGAISESYGVDHTDDDPNYGESDDWSCDVWGEEGA